MHGILLLPYFKKQRQLIQGPINIDKLVLHTRNNLLINNVAMQNLDLDIIDHLENSS